MSGVQLFDILYGFYLIKIFWFVLPCLLLQWIPAFPSLYDGVLYVGDPTVDSEGTWLVGTTVGRTRVGPWYTRDDLFMSTLGPDECRPPTDPHGHGRRKVPLPRDRDPWETDGTGEQILKWDQENSCIIHAFRLYCLSPVYLINTGPQSILWAGWTIGW